MAVPLIYAYIHQSGDDTIIQVIRSNKDFSRKRTLDFIKTITTILGFQGKTLDKELIDLCKPATAPALVQRRGKILPEAFYCRGYAEAIPVRKKYEGYRLIAANWSDVNTPYSKDVIIQYISI